MTLTGDAAFYVRSEPQQGQNLPMEIQEKGVRGRGLREPLQAAPQHVKQSRIGFVIAGTFRYQFDPVQGYENFVQAVMDLVEVVLELTFLDHAKLFGILLVVDQSDMTQHFDTDRRFALTLTPAAFGHHAYFALIFRQ
jgi:hypothetical protein